MIEVNCDKLSIRGGMQASLEYLRMIAPEIPADGKTRIRSDLLT